MFCHFIFLLLRGGSAPYFQILRPLRRALVPAKRSMTMTMYLTAEGFVFVSILTPTIEPNIMPIIEGTTIIGSTAPLFTYIHAADVSVIESRNLLVATE